MFVLVMLRCVISLVCYVIVYQLTIMLVRSEY